MKANEIFDNIYTIPFAEDDYSLNEFINDALAHVSWHLFKRQEEVCYMISECNPPKFKDNIVDVMLEEIYEEFGWIVDYMINHLLISYRFGNVDLGDEGEYHLRESLGEEGWEEFVEAAKKCIWRDYADILGEDQAIEYFKSINRPEYIKAGEDTE